eukprot:TRINITY_DN5360_c0_g2_i1.p4 TRINITY_DN5360_c0_g2~~TRINITY_DN5360_c0_g2_i1.p4  ORF type:complete len:136 (+),score=10.99 TRINITY_DN5360_c0_g2_i1:1332-1739(+)
MIYQSQILFQGILQQSRVCQLTEKCKNLYTPQQVYKSKKKKKKKMSSGQTLGVKAQRFRGHTSPHRNVKGNIDFMEYTLCIFLDKSEDAFVLRSYHNPIHDGVHLPALGFLLISFILIFTCMQVFFHIIFREDFA